MKRLILLAAIATALPIWSANIYFDTLPSTSMYGTYNGFVGGTIDSVRFGDLICSDYYATTYSPSGPWHFVMSTLPALTYARFGVAALDQYRQAAILLAGDGNTLAGLTNVADASAIADYQYALWRLFTPGAPLQGNAAAILATLQAKNLSNSSFASTYARLRSWTPIGDASSNQEFLQLGSAVPEPGTVGMLGCGLLFVGLMAPQLRRRRQ